MKKRPQSGFTLIELLVVISIISRLSSVIFASLNSARGKAKDALLKQEAEQMRILLEQEYNDNGSYAALNPNAWFNSTAQCDAYFTTGSYASQAKAICYTIMANSSVSYSVSKMHIGIASGLTSSQYAIMIALPYKNTFYCLSYLGRFSEVDLGTWGSPGCWGNP
jgi:prepilin-type N-terminal cleavage/methylation domain-containing protein